MPGGRSVNERIFGFEAPPPSTEFAAVSQDHVIDGLWDRAGLAFRDRRLLTLAVLATGANDAALAVHLDGALASGDLSPRELEEAAIHLAHYAGWPAGSRFEAAARAAIERRRTAAAASGPVGVVGVGALGGDVAATLIAAGVEVVVHDVRREIAEGIEGAVVAADLAEVAARCDTIGLVVRDDAQVAEVVEGLAATARPGTTILVHATVSTSTVRAVAATAAAAGVDLLDVGLCRPAGLDSGFVALVGGEAPVIDRVAPVLSAIAGRVFRVGPLGSGMVVKAVRNAMLYGAYASISEACDVARAAGIDLDELLAALETSGAAGGAALAFVTYREQWQVGEHADVATRRGFVDLARKDLGVAQSAAIEVGTEAPFAGAVAEAMPAAYLLDLPDA